MKNDNNFIPERFIAFAKRSLYHRRHHSVVHSKSPVTATSRSIQTSNAELDAAAWAGGVPFLNKIIVTPLAKMCLMAGANIVGDKGLLYITTSVPP